MRKQQRSVQFDLTKVKDRAKGKPIYRGDKEVGYMVRCKHNVPKIYNTKEERETLRGTYLSFVEKETKVTMQIYDPIA